MFHAVLSIKIIRLMTKKKGHDQNAHSTLTGQTKNIIVNQVLVFNKRNYSAVTSSLWASSYPLPLTREIVGLT